MCSIMESDIAVCTKDRRAQRQLRNRVLFLVLNELFRVRHTKENNEDERV